MLQSNNVNETDFIFLDFSFAVLEILHVEEVWVMTKAQLMTSFGGSIGLAYGVLTVLVMLYFFIQRCTATTCDKDCDLIFVSYTNTWQNHPINV